ncbi:lysophospholipid acyltransferase family protein [Fangia hongkongensis]|uniref:lysophospholipid acyltransferase family protein n=1 Tax=Fangia hongkongensis TaxID=270495 RepID=UPI00035FAF3C|nr:lysophospholipid acyltransferase family protein [Fangia hongkongensis]MBK2125274.1 lysophospholipid acyltransferase family protein [Fangia hongkongensis]
MNVFKKLGVVILISLLWLWSRLSLNSAQKIGYFIGSIFLRFNSNTKRVTQKNIALCFPELSAYHQKRLVEDSLRQMCITGAEMPAILFQSPKRLLRNLTVEDEDILQQLYSENRGLLVLGAHLGCWEIGSMYFPKHFPSSMLYTPPKIAFINKLIHRARSRLCKNMSPANHKGVKMLFAALKRKELVAMLSDQVPTGIGGTYLDFFNVPAKTMNFPGKLYERFKPAVIVGYPIRNKGKKGITMYIENLEPDIIEAMQNPDIEDPCAYAFTKSFEKMIERFPDQYQWSYKRFKYNPDGIDFYKKDEQ